MVKVPASATSSEWPSGAALATDCAPTTWAAPPLFSITTCWPHVCDSRSPSARHHVGHAAGGGRHRERDRAGGIGLRLRGGRAGKAEEQDQSAEPLGHGPRSSAALALSA